jgi:hypothetical protein
VGDTLGIHTLGGSGVFAGLWIEIELLDGEFVPLVFLLIEVQEKNRSGRELISKRRLPESLSLILNSPEQTAAGGQYRRLALR